MRQKPKLGLFSIYLLVCAAMVVMILGIEIHAAHAQTTGDGSTNAAVTGASGSSGTVAGASTDPEDLKRKIDEQNRNIEALNKEIQQYSALKDKTTAEAKTLQAAIQQLDKNAKSLDLDIKKTKVQIDKAGTEIKVLDGDIQTSEEKITDFQRTLAESLRDIQQAEDLNTVETLLAGKDISEALSAVHNKITFNDSLGKLLSQLRDTKVTLENDKTTKEKKKVELGEFQKELTGKKEVVVANKADRAKILTETKNQESNYQKIVADKQKQKAAFEKELFNYEAQLKYTLDPASIPKSGSAVFSWPLEDVYVTQKFGVTSASKRLYVSGSHNGVDFKALMGTKVMAVMQGRVVGTGDTDLTCPAASFGKWVLVEHPNGLSTIYAHLSVISVKAGDQVATGQMLGLSGKSGYVTGPHLHLGAYVASQVKVQERPSASCIGHTYTMPIAPTEAYLDALDYLPAIPTGKVTL
jgi:murein DD-endopeptidase MepM/ murein hydrolase activator NlpD